MMVNRIGDICLILALGLIFRGTGSLNFATLLDQVHFIGSLTALLATSSLLLVLAAVGKSAQLGLHT